MKRCNACGEEFEDKSVFARSTEAIRTVVLARRVTN